MFIMFGIAYGLISLYISTTKHAQISLFVKHINPTRVAIATLVIIALIVPQYLFYAAMKHAHDAHTISALSSIGPLFTLVFMVLFLNTYPSAMSIWGVSLIVLGVVLLTYF